MRDYSTVSPAFWTGGTGKELRQFGPETMLVAMYLVTSPHANALGLYYLPLLYISHETGIPLEGASESLDRCSEAGFCAYDRSTEVVWVYEMARFQIGNELSPKDNRVKWINSEVKKLPKCSFLKGFYDKYKDAFYLEKQSPSKAPSKPHRSQDQDQDQDQDQEQDKNTSSLHPEAVQLAERLAARILETNPKAKTGEAKAWTKHVDLMLRIDKRTAEEVAEVIDWCQRDSFWCSNILSTKKLREKFDQLTAQMNRKLKVVNDRPDKFAGAI